jgi:hypothetical protein
MLGGGYDDLSNAIELGIVTEIAPDADPLTGVDLLVTPDGCA